MRDCSSRYLKMLVWQKHGRAAQTLDYAAARCVWLDMPWDTTVFPRSASLLASDWLQKTDEHRQENSSNRVPPRTSSRSVGDGDCEQTRSHD